MLDDRFRVSVLDQHGKRLSFLDWGKTTLKGVKTNDNAVNIYVTVDYPVMQDGKAHDNSTDSFSDGSPSGDDKGLPGNTLAE